MSKLFSDKKVLLLPTCKVFKGIDGNYHYVYRTFNTFTQKEYIGVVSEKNYNNSRYIGSSKDIGYKSDIKDEIIFEILSFHNSRTDADKEEIRLVTKEYIKRLDTYNLTVPKSKFNACGIISVYDFESKTHCSMKIGDERLTSGRFLYSIMYNKNTEDIINKLTNVIHKYNIQGELISTYKNIMDASIQSNIPAHKIKEMCVGKATSYKGDVFLFDGDCVKNKFKISMQRKWYRDEPIYQFDLEGNFIMKHDNTNKHFVTINRTMVMFACNNDGNLNSHKHDDFIWLWESDKEEIHNVILANNLPRTNTKKVAQIDIKTGEIIKLFDSLTALISNGYSKSNISKVCNGKRKSAQGFYWKFIN